MEKTLKEVADSLLQKNKITQEEYDSFEMEKDGAGPVRTFISKALGNFGKGYESTANKVIGFGGGAVAGLSAAYMAKELVTDPLISTIQINNSYKKLMEKTPQLQSQDPAVIKDYFNIIKSYSPKVASNPMVAGALINKMIEFGGVDHKLIMDLMDMQSKVPTMAIPLLIGAGAKTLASPESVAMRQPAITPTPAPELKNKFSFRKGDVSFERRF